MPDPELNALIRKGMAEIERGNTLVALIQFEEAARQDGSPLIRSHLAFCLAKEKRQLNRAAALCNEAMREEPNNPVHYLNLGRIYHLAGQKSRAIQIWRRGLRVGRSPQIALELRTLGVRKQPVVKGLKREHPVNKYLGMILEKIGLR